MKKKLLWVITLTMITTTTCVLFVFNTSNLDSSKTAEEVRAKHQEFLDNSPFKNTDELTKEERFNRGLPPNKYFEREWELTMNPETGRPTPENLGKIRENLKQQRANQSLESRVSGDASGNAWVERGPNNVGGRSRAIMFDPNDATNETVFAAGVSGGLWKNTNISSAGSAWTRVDIEENLNITSIAVDPNDDDIFYVGTGESYVQGDVNGNGVWKSEDAGATWAHVFGGATGETVFETNATVTVNTPAGIAGDYIAIKATFGFNLISDITGDVVLVDDGTANPSEGCNALVNGAELNGKIALVYRGNCAFVDKVQNAQAAGAIATIVINNEPGNPFAMSGDAFTNQSVMISEDAGETLVNALGSGLNVTLSPNNASQFVGSYVLSGNQHVNDLIIRNNGGISEVFVAAGFTAYYDSNPSTLLGPYSYGLFKSTNGGSSWTLVNVPTTSGGNRYEPNDLEIGADNTVWMATRRNEIFGDGGGVIFSSSDGTNFTEKHSLDAKRTQIAASSTNPDRLYVLAQGNSVPVIIERTDDGFDTATSMALPDDADNGIPANDFTRGQSFYDLVIKVSPTSDLNVFVGGIDLFNSGNGGSTWSQISKWSNNNALSGLSVPLVHADQHAIAFGNGDSNKILFGNDGGVFYSSDGGSSIGARNNGFNVTQFYSVAVAPTTAITGDYFLAGAQDNANQFFEDAPAGISGSFDPGNGGDGAETHFDQDGTDNYLIINFVYNNSIRKYDYINNTTLTITNEGDRRGDFINQQDLDSNLDILYTNYSSGSNGVIRRYTVESAPVVATDLTNALLDDRVTKLKVSPYTTTSTTLLVGAENGKVLRVTNANMAGPTWEDISSPEFIGSIADLEFGQSESEIFVTIHNYGVKNIWYSNDAGVTWMSKEGDLPDLPVKAILQNPLNTNEVIVGTELGVWYTNNFFDADPTWNSAFNGMSNAKVTDLDLRDDNAIYASTYGRGVFSGVFTAQSLSIDNKEKISEIKLFPTVSSGDVTITSQSNLGDVKMEVFNINGQKVYDSEVNLSGVNKNIQLKGLSSGMYLAKFSKDNFSETKKIIIN